jgi:hypothetical protein
MPPLPPIDWKKLGKTAEWAARAAAGAARDAAWSPPPPPKPPLRDVMPAPINGAEHIATLAKFPSGGRAQQINRFVFPVNPETYTINHRRESQDVSLLTRGLLSRAGARNPVEISFEAFFPDPVRTPVFVGWTNLSNDDLPDPWTAVATLRDWQNSGTQADGMTPLRLVIADTRLAVASLWCMITSFDVSTKPREVGDVYFSISFKEVSSFPAVKKMKTRKPAGKPPRPRVNARPDAKTYTTKAGDHLKKIVKQQYHGTDNEHVKAVFNANKAAINKALVKAGGKAGDHLAVLPAGIVLKLPKVD